MSILNIQINSIAYRDNKPSNNPSIRTFDYSYKLLGIAADRAESKDYSLAPGETRTIFNGTRTTAIDGTTAFDVSQPNPAVNTYRFTNSGGTSPAFRTDRLPGIDNTSEFSVAVNGPLSTYTTTAVTGQVASFAGTAPGVPNTVVLNAVNSGTLGNSIVLNGTGIQGTAASFTGQVAGMTTNVTITDNNLGLAGNNTILVGDGVSDLNTIILNWNNSHSEQSTLTSGDGTQIPNSGATITLTGGVNPDTIAQLISNWNTANPSNHCVAFGGDSSQIPNLGAVLQFTGGVDGHAGMNTTNVQVGDQLKIEIGSGFNPANCGRFTILSKTSTSVTVQNLSATPESVSVVDSTKFYIYSTGGSSNQVQINDKVIISAGFSAATQGTYDISEVTPNWFEIAVAAPNGLPIETSIIPGVSGIVFYSAAKIFVMVAAQQKCSVRNNSDVSDNTLIEPIEVNNPEKPGIYIKQGTTYSLVINNLSLEPLSVVVSSAE